jgi:hypothetical protein
VFYAGEDFGGSVETRLQQQVVRARLLETLSRARPKELVHDYLDQGTADAAVTDLTGRQRGSDEVSREAVQAWAAMREQQKPQGPQLSEAQQAVEAWKRLHERRDMDPEHPPEQDRERAQGREGPELDL